MSFEVAAYTFEGPYASVNDLADKSGVYVVLCHGPQGRKFIDCGESDKVRSRLANHERADCWEREAAAAIVFGVCYATELQRMQIEQDIRSSIDFPCGEP